ncbi:MAG: hydrogenase maturation nickel metallochaperone HypA [Deltaproteobacteria bacterium]
MHETHLIEPIIKGIAEHAAREGGKSVSRVRLKLGLLLGVNEESFRETFKVLAKGTLLEGARLELNFFPGTRVEVVSFDIEET